MQCNRRFLAQRNQRGIAAILKQQMKHMYNVKKMKNKSI